MCAIGLLIKKLLINFIQDRNKCIFISREENLLVCNINNRIKKFNMVEYHGCYLDAILRGDLTAMKFNKEINI